MCLWFVPLVCIYIHIFKWYGLYNCFGVHTHTHLTTRTHFSYFSFDLSSIIFLNFAANEQQQQCSFQIEKQNSYERNLIQYIHYIIPKLNNLNYGKTPEWCAWSIQFRCNAFYSLFHFCIAYGFTCCEFIIHEVLYFLSFIRRNWHNR